MRTDRLLFLIFLLLPACESPPSMPHTVHATDYFKGAALPAALACQHDDGPALVRALAVAHLSPNTVGRLSASSKAAAACLGAGIA